MLKKILISKVRIKVLEYFMFNLDGGVHVRGLVRELDEEINAVRRELLNLKDAGLLTSEKQGNKVVYSVNPKCPILEDLRNMVYRDSNLGRSLIKIGKRSGEVKYIFLTDRFTKKNVEKEIDVLFIGDMKISTLSKEMKTMEKETEKELRYGAMALKDFDFARKKRDSFVMQVFDGDYILLFGSQKDLLL